jgi:hypothetical protein
MDLFFHHDPLLLMFAFGQPKSATLPYARPKGYNTLQLTTKESAPMGALSAKNQLLEINIVV